MAKIRMLTLEEWFSAHQLTYAFRKYCHNPITIDVDVTRMVQASEEAGVRFSPTAAVLKAVGVVLRLRPSLNRMLFHAPFGQRICTVLTGSIYAQMEVVVIFSGFSNQFVLTQSGFSELFLSLTV